MMTILLLVIGVVIIFLLWARISVDWVSFFKPTLPLDRGNFGVYCYDAKQGGGKTYALVRYLKREAAGRQIWSNIKLEGIDYKPIESVEHLLSLNKLHNQLIVFDEIFTLVEKGKLSKPLLNMLSQQRKHHNIFLTTAQEWLEINVTFRRYVRVRVKCRTIPLGRFGGVLIQEFEDATQMKWSNDENEYVCPRISLKVSKYEKLIMQSYDTFQQVDVVS